jgi:hypothetical protein
MSLHGRHTAVIPFGETYVVHCRAPTNKIMHYKETEQNRYLIYWPGCKSRVLCHTAKPDTNLKLTTGHSHPTTVANFNAIIFVKNNILEKAPVVTLCAHFVTCSVTTINIKYRRCVPKLDYCKLLWTNFLIV